MTKPYKCRVEYLESTGTQYIDTGITGNNNTKIDILFSKKNTTADYINGIVGARGSSVNENNIVVGINNAQIAIDFVNGGSGSYSTYRYIAVDTLADVKYRAIASKTERSLYKGNTLIGQNTTLSSQTINTTSLWMFKVKDYGATESKIYYCKIYDNDVLVRDFIPVLDNSGRPAMYDQVSGQLFYNQGTGEFTYGRQIIPVEYLESTGTQWIDTGTNVNTATDKIKLYYELTDTANYKWIFGEYDTNARIGLGSGDGTDKRNFLYQQTATKVSDSQMYGKQHLFEINSNGGFLDGTKIKDYASFASTSTIYLFNLNIDSSSDYRCKAKIWGYEQKRNNILILDLIPAIDENNTPFMFDKVHNTVYLNAGTGKFKVGPNVEKEWGVKKLRRKLALMLANLKKKRPYYCEVEYLESTGTQYILSGFTPTLNTDFEITLSSTNTGLNRWVMGCPTWVGVHYKGATNEVGITNSSTAAYQQYTPYNHDNSKLTMKLSGDTVYANGVSLGTITRRAGTLDFALFGYRDENNGATLNYIGNIYRCLIKDNGIPVRDFIPVLDWDMRPCMYDRVSGQFFYNQGSGDFSYGREIHYVDYLEADGTQYISTGITGTNENMGIDISWAFSKNDANMCIFSSRSGQTSNTFTLFWLKTSSNRIRFDGVGQQYFTDGVNASVSNNIFNFNYKSAVGAIATLTNKTTGNIQTLNIGKLETFSTNPLYLFCSRDTAYVYSWIKMYKCQIYDGSTIIRDYLPAIDENGVGYMFDKVSHTIYDNAGTGVFKYPARETEYIEVTDLGTNNQNPCIDLGLKYKSSMSIEAKYTRTGMGVSGSILPLSNSTTSPLIYMPALNASSKNDRFVWRRPPLPESSYYYDFEDYPLTIEFKVDAVNDALTINGNVAKTGMIAAMNGYESPYESSSNLYMLSINGTYGGMGKVYYVKIYDTTQVYRDLVPVWKDGVACVYDKQNNTYYSNTKTGTVICGKIVEPEYE